LLPAPSEDIGRDVAHVGLCHLDLIARQHPGGRVNGRDRTSMPSEFTSEATRTATQLKDLTRRAQLINERTEEPVVEGSRDSAVRGRGREVVGSSQVVEELLLLDRSDG